LNNERQNHPELVVQDLARCGLPAEEVRYVLKRRGVAKWLAVRRLIIAIKARWKERIAEVHEEKRRAKQGRDFRRYNQLVGYERALVECRQQVRACCHHTRDVDWPADPKVWAPLSVLPATMPARPNKRWLARFFGKVAA
jgi:hypothetical protein